MYNMPSSRLEWTVIRMMNQNNFSAFAAADGRDEWAMWNKGEFGKWWVALSLMKVSLKPILSMEYVYFGRNSAPHISSTGIKHSFNTAKTKGIPTLDDTRSLRTFLTPISSTVCWYTMQLYRLIAIMSELKPPKQLFRVFIDLNATMQ